MASDDSTREQWAASIEPEDTRPSRLAIWLPAALTALFLLVIGIGFAINWRPVAHKRHFITGTLQPALQQLIELRLAFKAERLSLNAFAALPQATYIEQFWPEHERRTRALSELRSLTPRLGAPFEARLATLENLLTRWDSAALAAMDQRMTAEAYRARLSEQNSLAQATLTEAATLTSEIEREMRRSIAFMGAIERRRLLLLAGFLPLALISAVLTARYGSQARRLTRRQARRASEEALLRDAMAVLTGAEVPPEALDRIAGIALRVGDAAGAYIEESDDGRTTVEVVGAAGEGVPAKHTRVPYAGSVTDEVVRMGVPQVADLSVRGGEIGRTIGEKAGHRAGLAVPIQDSADLHGVLVLVCRQAQTPTIRDDLIERIRVLGALAALALRRQRLDAELAAERRRLEAVVEQMPAGVVIADAPSGRIATFNRQAIEIWPGNIKAAEHIDDYAQWSGFHADGRPYEAQEWPLARSIQTGARIDGEEIELIRSDGTRAIVRFSSAPIRDARGEITAGVVTLYDISDQKRRELVNQFLADASRVLASSLDYEATLKSVLDLSVPRLADRALAYLLDRDGKDITIRRIEPASSDPEQKEIIDTIGRRYPLTLDSTHPAAVAIRTGKPQLVPQVTDETLTRIAQDPEHLRLLRMLNIQSGMTAPLIVRGKPLGALLLGTTDPARKYGHEDLALAEELARRAALAVDNAELFRSVSKAEKRARFLAETAQSLSGSLEYEDTVKRVARMAVPYFADFTIAFLTDAQGITTHTAVAHRSPEQEELLREAGDLYRPLPRNLASTVMRAARTGRPVLVQEVTPELVESLGFQPRMRELFAGLAPVSWITVPLIARDATLGAIVFATAESGRHYTNEDVSLALQIASRAALAMQNATLFGEVHDALRTRDDVLAIVSHDLRNPLHTISMSAELLLETPVDTDQLQHQLLVIQKAVERMERLIQDLLDVARIQAGKTLAIEARREPARSLIREACEAFGSLAEEKDIRLEWDAPRNLPDVVADHGRIIQVLANLIRNALEFTPEAGRVEVKAHEIDGFVEVSVRDSGPGIHPEDIERIFRPFWQAPRASRTGAGLGLSIARGIINEHRGHIWVESHPGAGSTFTFTLPVAPVEAESKAA